MNEKPPQKTDNKTDLGLYEILDRSMILHAQLSDAIVYHSSLKKYPTVKCIAETAQSILMDLYQAAAEEWHKQDHNDEKISSK